MPASITNNLMATNVANTLNSHYGKLATSVERLSSGLRINSAADDAAGLAIRELMRADVAALNQGVRNANDAISMLQVADGALGIIDEKLIRMKELAEQAATGTYNSTQRLMIHSEFVAMAEEIDRIARATDFNGIKLLNGSLSGQHNGNGLTATGAMKIHFGTNNDSAEDYYYVEIGNCTLAGLGLRDKAVTTINAGENTGVIKASAGGGVKAAGAGGNLGNIPILKTVLSQGTDKIYYTRTDVAIAVIPKGTKKLTIHLNDADINDTIQIFSPTGKHIAGTQLTDNSWQYQSAAGLGLSIPDYVSSQVLIPQNGFDDNATYDGSTINGIAGGGNLTFTDGLAGNIWQYNNMNIGYSGDGNPNGMVALNGNPHEYLTIDETTEDLILCIAGDGPLILNVNWTYMPDATGVNPPDPPNPPNPPRPDVPTPDLPQGDIISIRTQDEAQQALGRIEDAIVKKDKVRAHLGAMQNRLENTVTNLATQAENLMTS